MLLASKSAPFSAVSSLMGLFIIVLLIEYLLLDPSSHALTAGAFGAFGYFVYNLQERQNQMIAAKKEVMVKNRARAEELAASQ